MDRDHFDSGSGQEKAMRKSQGTCARGMTFKDLASHLDRYVAFPGFHRALNSIQTVSNCNIPAINAFTHQEQGSTEETSQRFPGEKTHHSPTCTRDKRRNPLVPTFHLHPGSCLLIVGVSSPVNPETETDGLSRCIYFRLPSHFKVRAVAVADAEAYPHRH